MELFGLLFALSVWGWLLIVAAVVLLTVLVESERGTAATVITVGMLSTLIYWAKFNLYSSVLYHPGSWLGWIGGWILVGIGWGLIKWFMKVHKELARYQEGKAKFLENRHIRELTPALAVELENWLGSIYEYREASPIPPKASAYKSDIIRWMTYWPFSMIGFVLRDFVRKIWNHIYIWLAKTYDRIASYVYRDVAGDAALMEQGRNMPRQAVTDQQPPYGSRSDD